MESDHDYYISFLCLLAFAKLKNLELGAALDIASDLVHEGLHPNLVRNDKSSLIDMTQMVKRGPPG